MKIAEEIARRHYENPYSNWENGIEALTKEIEEFATQEVAKNLHKPLVSGSGFVSFDNGKVKGLFISVPYNTIVEECHFKDKESLRFALMVCCGSKNATPSFIPIVIPEGKYKIVGLSSQIDEKTVEENLQMSFKEYLKMLSNNDITVSYSDFSNYWLVVVLA